jgi:hypothetical protein
MEAIHSSDVWLLAESHGLIPGEYVLCNFVMEIFQTSSMTRVSLGHWIITQTSDNEEYSSLTQISLGASVIENINNFIWPASVSVVVLLCSVFRICAVKYGFYCELNEPVTRLSMFGKFHGGLTPHVVATRDRPGRQCLVFILPSIIPHSVICNCIYLLVIF